MRTVETELSLMRSVMEGYGIDLGAHDIAIRYEASLSDVRRVTRVLRKKGWFRRKHRSPWKPARIGQNVRKWGPLP